MFFLLNLSTLPFSTLFEWLAQPAQTTPTTMPLEIRVLWLFGFLTLKEKNRTQKSQVVHLINREVSNQIYTKCYERLKRGLKAVNQSFSKNTGFKRKKNLPKTNNEKNFSILYILSKNLYFSCFRGCWFTYRNLN